MGRKSKGATLVALMCLGFLASWFLFFYYRDNFSTHYPVKVVSADILQSGQIPLWNFFAGGGQPLGGNPNTLTFYPDNILYLLLPVRVAFNLHFLIHLLAGWCGLRALARRFGAGAGASAIGATIYLLSGAAVSCLSFYNLVPSIALLPAIFLAGECLLADPSPRSALLLGASCGLLGLAGEPVMVISAAGGLLLLAAGRRICRRTIGAIALAGIIAVAVTSPLLAAYREIASEVERGFQPYSTETVLAASLRPMRALELVTGPFLGSITNLGAGGYRIPPGQWPPFLPTVFFGAILVPAFGSRYEGGAERLRYAGLLFLFLAPGRFNPLVAAAVSRFDFLRLVRYPEKFMIPFTVAAALLAALWLERKEASRALRISMVIASLMILILASAMIMGGELTPIESVRLGAGTIIAVAILLGSRSGTVAAKRMIVAATLLPMAIWALGDAPVDLARYYGRPTPLSEGIRGRLWEPTTGIPLQLPALTARHHYRLLDLAMAPLSGMARGVSYALDRSPEGMYSWLSRIVQERMSASPLPMRIRYFRMLHVGTLVMPARLLDPGLTLQGEVTIDGNLYRRYLVSDPMPMVMPVRNAIPSRSVQEAIAKLEAPAFDIRSSAIVPSTVHNPGGEVRIRRVFRGPQHLRIELEAPEGGLLVVNQSYFSAWVAKCSAGSLGIFPANVDRLGLVVPPDCREIRLSFGRHRQGIALCWSLSLALLLAAALAAIRSRNAMDEPAR